MRKGVVQLYIKSNGVIFSLAWNIIFSNNWKVLVLKFWGIKEYRNFGKYGLFLSQKVDGNIVFTDYWKVLVLNFSVMGITAFFFSQKVYEKMIFTWSFWAFYDTPGPGKYGFPFSVFYRMKNVCSHWNN